MLSHSTYLRIVRIGAAYDLLVSLPYATPVTLGLMWGVLGSLQVKLGFGALLPLDVHATLFANFFGTVVVLWSMIRLLRAETAFGRYDAVGRFAFALWMITALLHGATPLLLGFLVIEFGFGIAQALPVRKAPAVVTP